MNTEVDMQDPYWSRTDSQWGAVERCDPLPERTAPGPLSAEQVAAYARNGFHFDRQLFDADRTELLLAQAKELAHDHAGDSNGVIIEPHSRAVRSIFRVHRTSQAFRQVAKDRRIVEVVRQLIGTDVYVFQSRINFKPAFNGKEFFWHSDFETWHTEDGMPRMRAVSVSINLTENNEFNGPLMVVAGSHRTFIRCVGRTPENHYEKSLKKQEYGVPSSEAIRMLVEAGGIESPKGGPGSGLFFDCNTIHGSAGNLSPYPRTNLFLVYNSVDNPLEEPYGGQPPRPEFLAERTITPIDQL